MIVRSFADPATQVTVYTGSTLTGLTQVALATGPLTGHFPAVPGTTYFIQVARSTSFPSSSPLVTFTLDEPGTPFVGFSYFPFDPSPYDTVQLTDSSFDPAGIGFGPAEWDFGDGATASGFFVSHRWATDGDYLVTMVATTLDGRTATSTQTVMVRTHDVSIDRIVAPNSARVGQTKEVRVRLRGGRYPETVQVDLYKSVAGGYDQLVGSVAIVVPAGGGGRTTDALFTYTFTPDDGATGKVTFRALATLTGARDALPADNQAIASPTGVRR